MKKIFISLLAVAALAACTKSEVAYEAPAEITFAPAAKNITKAAHGDVGENGENGAYPTEQRLGVFANYGSDAPSANADVANYKTKFLENVLFSHNGTAWGAGESWPANGSLIFAGYAIPKGGAVNGNGNYNYVFGEDKLTITGYTQSNDPAASFDLGWFNRTSTSYNNRNDSAPVSVTLSHALAWVEFKVLGTGTTVGENAWIIKSITMNNVATTGDAVCIGTGADKAKWNTLSNPKSITVFTGSQPLTANATVCETANTDVIVIPQTPTEVLTDGTLDVAKSVATLTVTYTYKSPAGEDMPLQTVTVPLVLGTNGTDSWKSGYKYTYTLTFKASEILIAPDYGTWENGGDKTVTVE